MWLESLRKPAPDSAECPTCGGHVRRRDYGEMHAGSSILDGQRVEIRRRPADGFIDPIVLDPLTQYFDGHLYRTSRTQPYFAKGGSTLHRDVWRRAFGPVPDACHIHHRDSNTSNNQLRNLECVPASEHLSASWRKRADKLRAAGQPHFSPQARVANAAWHASEAGRLWHQRQAKRSKGWTKWKRADVPCVQCGKTMVGALVRAGNGTKYCSSKCKNAAISLRRKARRDG